MNNVLITIGTWKYNHTKLHVNMLNDDNRKLLITMAYGAPKYLYIKATYHQ